MTEETTTETELDATPDTALDDALPGDVKRQEFMDLVAESAGLKRKDIRDGMIHTLTVIGRLLEEGRSLNVPPLGKLRIVKEKSVGQDARMITLKLRHKDIVDEDDDTDENETDAVVEPTADAAE